MAIIDLDKRSKEILQRLINSSDYLQIQTLAFDFDVTKRSIYYDLDKINHYLAYNGLSSVVNEKSLGVRILDDQKDRITKLISSSLNPVFSPLERVDVIICEMVLQESDISVDGLMKLCNVSRNTIISDIKAVTSRLAVYELNLVYKHKKGYKIVGDVIKKRAIYFLCFPEISDYYKSGTLPLFRRDRVYECLRKLEDIETLLGTKYVDGILFTLASFIPTIETNYDLLSLTLQDRSQIMQTKEYYLVYQSFPALRNDEKIYIALHLLGSRLQTDTTKISSAEKEEETYTLAKELTSEFIRYSCINFERPEDVVKSLFYHLKTSLYRYRYGIQLGNPLLGEIKEQYPELFELTKKASECIRKQIGVPISENEIAYLTLIFGGFVQIKKERKMKIMVVCPNGVSTSAMLKNEVSRLVPEGSVINSLSVSESDKVASKYDLVISTVPLSISENVLIVRPVLTDANRSMILKKCLDANASNRVELNELINIIIPYVSINDIEELKLKLRGYLDSKNRTLLNGRNEKNVGLKDLLPTHLQFFSQGGSWEKALFDSGFPLLKENYIQESYLDSIVSSIHQYGSYMFVGEMTVLAHARIEDGVNKIGLSAGIFLENVEFPANRNARIIFVLAAEDHTKHLNLLKEILSIFSNPNYEESLLKCTNEEDFLQNIGNLLSLAK